MFYFFAVVDLSVSRITQIVGKSDDILGVGRCVTSNESLGFDDDVDHDADPEIFRRYFLHCALASGTVYCNRSCLCVCVFVVGGRSEPYYSQRACSVCVSLSVFFITIVVSGQLYKFC